MTETRKTPRILFSIATDAGPFEMASTAFDGSERTPPEPEKPEIDAKNAVSRSALKDPANASAPLSPGDFDSLRALAAAKGVRFSLRCVEIGRECRIVLGFIERKSGRPGSGAEILKALFDVADAKGVAVSLFVFDREPKLIDYYRNLGFEMTAGGDFWDPEMKRAARAPSEATSPMRSPVFGKRF